MVFKTIRHRLLVILLSIIVVVGSVTVWHGHVDARHEVREIYDAELAKSARLLLSQALQELDGRRAKDLQALFAQYQVFGEHEPHASDEGLEEWEDGHPYELKFGFQVWDAQGALLLYTNNLGMRPLSESDHGYDEIDTQGYHWRVFSIWDNSRRYKAVAAERSDVRQELIDKLSRHTLIPALVSLPILVVAIILGIGGGLSPLRKVAAEVSRRESSYLEPLNMSAMPQEIQPLTRALNALLERLQVSFDKERRFTADAAHELRTPLAGMKAQAQVASRAKDKGECRHALGLLLSGVDRATHLVDQLLTLARLDPDASLRNAQPVELRREIIEALANLAPLAIASDVELELLDGGDGQISGEAALIEILVRNIVKNAIAHTPKGGRVTVEIQSSVRALTIIVSDTGPGMPFDLRKRAFERFYRAPGNDKQGCGLGLSIVKRIADLHGGKATLSDRKGGSGLVVRVRFPAI